ncbi:hypothetical protein QMZ92_27715 [Streptomyces sp. HNM0645]|uniref:hypothetical protein n=1 Tax=Streptomyces sp. HNM0645 TaxID=2782343 RepID=UPI0024B7B9EC|nr:hypothetical protein [Streptomyces sp. HNM0645]MDI9888053.1 hypothetical protein [Streptomyces sp. HNM0645]
MGWTVLYIAFGIVALWLLGEVLLQYKARLRWRLVAFVGFLGVVVGVLMPNIIVIGVGAAAFAVGQTYVTLSFRRGFSTGWALGGSPGSSRRRRSSAPVDRDPVLEVTGIDYEDSYEGSYDDSGRPRPSGPDPDGSPSADTTAVYEPQPLPDETGQYGVYSDAAQAANHAQAGEDAHYGGYSTGYADAYSQGHDYQQPAGTTHDAYAGSYDYGTGGGQQQYAAWSEPYAGAAQGYGSYESYGGQQQYADPYASQGYNETPPGGVWVPLQRDGDQAPPPAEQPSQYGYDQGYQSDPDGQAYRY